MKSCPHTLDGVQGIECASCERDEMRAAMKRIKEIVNAWGVRGAHEYGCGNNRACEACELTRKGERWPYGCVGPMERIKAILACCSWQESGVHAEIVSRQIGRNLTNEMEASL